MSHGRTYDEQRFSPLEAINTETVEQLGLAWFADFDTNRGQEGTPLYIDGVLYTSSAWSKVHAFDAGTGRKLWSMPVHANIVAGAISFEHAGEQYVAVSAGGPGGSDYYAPNGSRLLVFRLDGKAVLPEPVPYTPLPINPPTEAQPADLVAARKSSGPDLRLGAGAPQDTRLFRTRRARTGGLRIRVARFDPARDRLHPLLHVHLVLRHARPGLRVVVAVLQRHRHTIVRGAGLQHLGEVGHPHLEHGGAAPYRHRPLLTRTRHGRGDHARATLGFRGITDKHRDGRRHTAGGRLAHLMLHTGGQTAIGSGGDRGLGLLAHALRGGCECTRQYQHQAGGQEYVRAHGVNITAGPRPCQGPGPTRNSTRDARESSRRVQIPGMVRFCVARRWAISCT